MQEEKINIFKNQVIENLISGNKKVCMKITELFLSENYSIKFIYENIFKSALYKIGELWEMNKISVATEHLASAIVETIMSELYQDYIYKNKTKKNVVLGCVQNEYHQIGVKMVSDIFETNGWNTHFLGANVPTKEMITFAQNLKPDILALSVSLYFHLPEFEKMVYSFRKEFPDTQIIVGGQAFRSGSENIIKNYNNVFLLSDLFSLETFINKI